jgi:signal transduction histidine kinase
METAEVFPGRDPPVSAEILHASDRTRITRLFLPGRTVIRKEPLGPDAQRRLRHELAMLERLRGISGVVQLAEPRYPGSLSLADVAGTSLAGTATPLDADVLIGLGSALARAVAGMHSRLVMHRDISPANIVISGDGVPRFIDFALATTFADIRPEFTHHRDIVGTLAYLAPEQTGRTGRPVDQRADLYALGATLYELATGAPPFGSSDPLRLTHDHLTRVPVRPTELNPAVPATLSEIILHLLEKEPDNRYQTAEGVVHDLQRLAEARTGRATGPARVGQHDLPLRLLPPSRLVGRDAEVAALHAAFDDARAGRCRAVLVGGAPGVGKTALIDELRPVVTRSGGWFVAGKFDQFRRDLEASGVYQAFRALSRLLLAEPEDELAEVRDRIRAALGPNASLMAAVVPGYATLLAVPPDPGDPMTAQVRGQRNGVQILRSVVSRERPIVLFVDDLQWAGRTPLGFLDLLVDEEPIEGLLMVGSHREVDRNGADPLAASLSRWRDRAGVREVRLDNLSVPSQVTMVAEMLHVDQAAAAGLVEVIEPHTSGNPYETVELLNALRRDGVLTATAARWRWEPAAVRLHLNRPGSGRLLATPVAAMPARSRHLVEAMACLGGRATVTVLQTATGAPAAVVEQLLRPAFDEGVLVVEPGADQAVRFRHDRIHEAILDGLNIHRRRRLQLAVARRLARVPELAEVAAEQYLPVVDAIDDPIERQRVVELLRRAADHARAVATDHALVSTLLGAALALIDPRETGTLVEVHIRRHAALFGLGRLAEADEEYRVLEGLCPLAVERADATAVQVSSLTHRNRFGDAVALGVASLRDLGIAVPSAERFPVELDAQVDHLYRWLDEMEGPGGGARPDITDPTLLAATRLINAILPPAFFAPDFSLYAWLSLETVRIWMEHGPGRSLLGPATHAANAVMALRGDYSVGYRAMRYILTRGEARGFEPETSLVRASFATLCCWFEPIERAVQEAERAREGLVAGGELAWAGYAYQPSVAGLLDCATTLDVYVAEVDAGLAFMRRTGNEQTGQWLDSHRWLADVLRGTGGEGPAAARDPITADLHASNPAALLYGHIAHAIAGAVFQDQAGLAQHAAAAMPLLPAAAGLYPTAIAHLMRGLALAEQTRRTNGAERGALLPELDDVTQWLAVRASDAPDNFGHLVRLVEAERAWAVGDFRAAFLAFDAALRDVGGRNRPWHRALITERAARFHFAHGAEHAGHDLLAQAREAYAAWGADAKVAQLDWAHPTLRPRGGTTAGPGRPADAVRQRSTVTTGTLDLLGILSASQALSSETSIERLHARVVEVLSAMTGATGVHLLLWSDDHHEWLPAPGRDAGTAEVDDTASKPDMPMSVLRYVQRVREPLVIDDATRDDRFAQDPYFAGVTGCSLLALPVLGRGAVRAVLLLENRLIRGAFTSERLDAVKLIAAQLTVSLDNAQLYAELTMSRARIVTAGDQTRRRIERDLHDGAQQRLVTLAMQARMAQAVVPPGFGELDARLDALATEANRANDELRELAHGIHPAVLAEGGLQPALRALARRSAVPVALQVRIERRLPEQIEIAAYFAVAEALTNTAKHAHATTVTVVAGVDEDAVLRVRVSDDGRGGADIGAGSGLMGLKDRVESLGGRLSVQTAPGAGTTVHAELPLSRPPTVRG